jgi:RNA polymerase sigma-70 factor, ECF subfamily
MGGVGRVSATSQLAHTSAAAPGWTIEPDGCVHLSRSHMNRRTIERAGHGDRDALRELYVRYAPPVHRHVRAIVRDEDEAEDVTQLVFLKLVGSVGSYDERRGDFTVWLLRVARNLAIDELRRRRPVLAGELHAPPDARSDDSGTDRAQALREALAALSDEQREVVVLRHVVGMGPREIAARLAKSEASIHALHRRGRLAMQASLLRAEVAPVTQGLDRP